MLTATQRRMRAPEDERQDAAYAQRMKRWANEEGGGGAGGRSGGAGAGSGRGGGRNTGTSVAGAGASAAVTGHHHRSTKSSTTRTTAAKAKAKTVVNPGAGSAPPVRKTTSALSVVADRRGRFGA